MDIYSVTLALALAAAVAALGMATLSTRHAGFRRGAWGTGFAALGLVVISTASHLFMGHRPGTPAELAPTAFLAAHPAIIVASALAVGALLLIWRTRNTASRADASRGGT